MQIHSYLLRLPQIALGIFFLIAPFVRRFRSESHPSSNVIAFFVGIFTECSVAFSCYIDSLTATGTATYLRLISFRGMTRGIVIGLLAAMAIRHVYAHRSKSDNG